MAEYCVTGGTGYIAAYLVKTLLQKGHKVRTTVRDPENENKVGFLWRFEGANERLKIMKADLLVEGSFDEAVDGVDGVFHIACPVASPPFDDDTVQATLIDPAVKGTANVLRSCIKATSVRRVVFTSSSSTTRCRYDVHKVSPLNESHWSDLEYCKEFKLWYAYAKTLAEKEAWKMAEESGIYLVTVVPSFVVGPSILPQPTSSLEFLLRIIRGEKGSFPDQMVGFVHTDDVISSHILAMEEPKASGRILCSGSVVHWSEIIDMLKAKYPMYPFENKLITDAKGDTNTYGFDTSKILKLGFPGFKTIPEMFDDCIKSFQDNGLL